MTELLDPLALDRLEGADLFDDECCSCPVCGEILVEADDDGVLEDIWGAEHKCAT